MDPAEDVTTAESLVPDATVNSFTSSGEPTEKDRCNMLIINRQNSKFKTLTFLIIFIFKL